MAITKLPIRERRHKRRQHKIGRPQASMITAALPDISYDHGMKHHPYMSCAQLMIIELAGI